jgi:hypothetical protein
MIVVEHSKVELDYCTNCQGVWFDTGELELLLNSADVDGRNLLLTKILNSPVAESTEKKRKCPICSNKMKKTTVGQQPEILIDVCRQGDGLWFDGGEVTTLVKQIANELPSNQDSQQKMLDFLRDVFKAPK